MNSAAGTFSIKARCLNAALILGLSGDLTLDAEELLASHTRCMDQPKGLEKENRLILNFEGVNRINSGGLTVLMHMAHERSIGGCQIFGCGLTFYFAKLFRIVGLTQYIMVYPDEYAILQRLGIQKAET